MAIENLREGDLVVARHEVTGELGEFPITSLMAREAPGVIWLTLEDAAGKTSKLGVTDEHPLFVVGKGWTKANRIKQGEQIKDSRMEALKVAVIDFGVRPLQVHNLEVAGAWTYFVGDLEAWGHNSRQKSFQHASRKRAKDARNCGTGKRKPMKKGVKLNTKNKRKKQRKYNQPDGPDDYGGCHFHDADHDNKDRDNRHLRY